MITFLAQIEAVLNSRPLYALSDDPTDFSALTPAHFLTGEPFIMPPTIESPSQSNNSLKRIHDEQQKMLNHFWDGWQIEYLATLLPRKKWLHERDHYQIGQLVIIKNENLPPSRWLLGRIYELIKSPDGLVRSVMIRTAKNKFKRAVQKICVLPLVPSESNLQSIKLPEEKIVNP